MPRNSSWSIRTLFAPLVFLIRSPHQTSPLTMAIEYPSSLHNPNPTPTSATAPMELSLTIEPLVISSPFAHHLQLDFPSDNYILGLYAILTNPRLAPTIEPHLDIGSLFFALFHLHRLATCLHSAAHLTIHPDHLWASILSIHEDLLSHIHQLFHQLGLDYPNDLIPHSPHPH